MYQGGETANMFTDGKAKQHGEEAKKQNKTLHGNETMYQGGETANMFTDGKAKQHGEEAKKQNKTLHGNETMYQGGETANMFTDGKAKQHGEEAKKQNKTLHGNEWIYGSISNGHMHKNSFIEMAYGPPAKKLKTQPDEEDARQELSSLLTNENLVIRSEPFPERSEKSVTSDNAAKKVLSDVEPGASSVADEKPAANVSGPGGEKLPEIKKEEVDDPFAALDWRNGIATLPGSNLKFKMTEFGTLEIVSTVETDKGEYEWSTPTQHRKPSVDDGDTNKKQAKSASKDAPNGLDVTMQPDTSGILCCEVCGKYGLPQEFSASGRFCSLSCVGVYTGRRNKGREYVRHAKTVDGKIVKRKKKGKGKNAAALSKPTDSALEVAPSQDVVREMLPGEPRTFKGKRKRMKNKLKFKKASMNTADLLKGEDVPYDSTKPFVWDDYLTACGSAAVPFFTFKQENSFLAEDYKPCAGFEKDMKLEAIDPKHPSFICVCTIVRVKGTRLRLHFDGWSESYDFWTSSDSPFLFPVGWCANNGQDLHPPRGMSRADFSWDNYLKNCEAKAVPESFFKPVLHTKHGFRIGMKLEAVDRMNPDLICVATVTNVIGNHFLVHFDEWDDSYDYWCGDDCPYIRHVMWCAENNRNLNPPNDDEFHTFRWEEYLKSTGAVAAPKDAFKKRPPPSFQSHHKLEAVDKRNPSLVRAATIAEVNEHRVRIHFDGWDDIYDEWFESDCLDLYPIGWCEKTGHPLETPLTTREKISSAACPTPGCKGIGHVKGAKYSTHHSTFGCPYSIQNLNKDSCLVDRLSNNSMTEESDWSYASKQKMAVVKAIKEDVSTNQIDGACPTPGCDGSGHVSGQWKSHYTVSGCPRVKHLSKSPTTKTAPLHSPTPKNASVSSANSAIISTRSTSRRVSNKEDRPDNSRPKVADKAIQHVSPFSFPWPLGSGFPSAFLNELKSSISQDNGALSNERQRIMSWNIDDVASHVCRLGCGDQAKIFVDQLIDGEAFLLLNQSDIVNILKIKLGPALKIYNTIPKI